MTLELAKQVLEIAERARKSIATHGEIPADWVAKAYHCTRGQGLHMIIEAKDVVAHGEVCPTCHGTGRIPTQPPLFLPSFTYGVTR
jgi:hypothetical protein